MEKNDFEELVNKALDYAIKACLLFLLVNLFGSLIWNSWKESTISIFNNAYYLITYVGVMVFCLIWSLKERIIKISMSQEGISAELEQVQKARNEVTTIQQEVYILYKDMLQTSVTLIENSQRWSGWTKKRYNHEIQKLKEQCIRQNISPSDQLIIFKSKNYWDKVDKITSIKNQIATNLIDQEQKDLLDAEYSKITDENHAYDISAQFLEKFLGKTSLDMITKNKLLEDIQKLS